MSRQASWLGGSARVQSHIGGGSHVRISIPLTRHRRVDGQPAEPTAGASREAMAGEPARPSVPAKAGPSAAARVAADGATMGKRAARR
jgi:hypothetical protein